MHDADVWDQIRKDLGIEVAHRTGKWTVRMLEICWSMIMAQGYNVYRYNNALPQPRLSSHQFKLANILGLLNHQVVNGPQVASPEVMPTEYKLHEWPIGCGTTARMQPN